jgi:hypothetical protein
VSGHFLVIFVVLHVEVLQIRVRVGKVLKVPCGLVLAGTLWHALWLRAISLIVIVGEVVVIVEKHSLALGRSHRGSVVGDVVHDCLLRRKVGQIVLVLGRALQDSVFLLVNHHAVILALLPGLERSRNNLIDLEIAPVADLDQPVGLQSQTTNDSG